MEEATGADAMQEQESSGEEYLLFCLHPEDRSSFTIHVGVNGATLQMEVHGYGGSTIHHQSRDMQHIMACNFGTHSTRH